MKKLIALSLAYLITPVGLFAAETPSAPAKPKSYQIRNVKFAELLRPEDANSANGTRIVLYPAQTWKCLTWKLHPAGESEYQLQNHFTSKTIAAQTNAAQVVVVQVPFGSEASKRPAWRFTKLSDGFYQIIDLTSGQALSAVSTQRETIVVLAPWKDQPGQKWELIETDPGKLTM
ncbi:MAG: RICIN domain-containing protein [Akkermansiaceae bacterium]|nr:RICIN domain-containing protein [Verrucomicrobiales bacterium]